MRIEKLRAEIADRDLDGMLVTDPLNRRYISGFTGSAGALLVTADRAMIAIDFRYFQRADREAPAWEQVRVTTTGKEAIARMVGEAGVRRLGVESDHMTLAQHAEMQETLDGVELMPVKGLFQSMRAIKDPTEVAAIRRAVDCADAAFAHLCTVIRPGMTECEVAWELESHMRTHGATATSFPLIVGSGPNGALPHAGYSDRPIQTGEPIVLDFGALIDGYCSDITRTLCLGSAEGRYDEVWHLVLEAQQAVEAQLKPGMTGQEADAIARDLFTERGYEEPFGHGLGHGVGLAIHEMPSMGRLSDEVILKEGMVVTVEPGLYFPGWGGVRIEDIVVVGVDGVEVLTGSPKEPVLDLP